MEQIVYRVCVNPGDPVCGSAPGGGRQGRKEGLGNITDCCGRLQAFLQDQPVVPGDPGCSGTPTAPRQWQSRLPLSYQGTGLGKHEYMMWLQGSVLPQDFSCTFQEAYCVPCPVRHVFP